MNDELSLTLELLEQAELRFRVTIRNQSGVKLLLPYPRIHGLRFGNQATKRESEWYTNQLVSADWNGFTFLPGEDKVIAYHVRPCAVDPPPDNDFSDYYRWCVDLPSGEYLVWFCLEVGKDYFCPESHYRYADLLREAEDQEARVWSGQVLSNRVHVAFAHEA